ATSGPEAAAQLGAEVDLIVDGGDSPASGTASTVLDLTTSPALIRRRGSIPMSAIRSALAARVDYALEA
ncbi:MAG TPA: Sua5/YciO/YrdC/YwlC family protein, partial [Chloroflexota bacterium]|nr:Sua5/YciO/YrdC/YwlC family protein [Chloroflexota bacterium]